MIIVTGGLGFIGRNLVQKLLKRGKFVIVLDTKIESLNSIYIWLTKNAKDIECIYHLGAITDTTEMNIELFNEYNLHCSMFVWNLCTEYQIPLIYASSAATYGDGKQGFDDEKSIKTLQPLNPYGDSKHVFDLWNELEDKTPPYWYGLKFFNVYGYGEANKGKMASVVFHTYNQVKLSGEMKLFRSHNPNFGDGEQLRDFVYVDDVVDVCIFMMENLPKSGIYNVGTGKARSFIDLTKAVFNCLGIHEKISYIDTPIEIRDKYQYFTEAKIAKLRNIGYIADFHELEYGVEKYINKLKYENR